MPLASVLALFNVTVVLAPGVSGLLLKLTVVPAGTPAVAVSTIGVEKPPLDVEPKVTSAVAGPAQAMVVGVVLLNVKPEGGGVIAKFVLEMSKKIFPTDSILTLAVVVAGTAGKFTTSVPSLGVLAESTNGKVWPPSVDNNILTSEQLTGAVVVFATFQVMVCADEAGHDTFVFGCVTWNGPEVFVTVTTMSVNAVWPTFIGAVEL